MTEINILIKISNIFERILFEFSSLRVKFYEKIYTHNLYIFTVWFTDRLRSML